MQAGVAISRAVGWDPGMFGLRASQLVAGGSILAYYSDIYHLLRFCNSVYLSVSSFPSLLATVFPFKTWIRGPLCLCDLDIIGV